MGWDNDRGLFCAQDESRQTCQMQVYSELTSPYLLATLFSNNVYHFFVLTALLERKSEIKELCFVFRF